MITVLQRLVIARLRAWCHLGGRVLSLKLRCSVNTRGAVRVELCDGKDPSSDICVATLVRVEVLYTSSSTRNHN